MLSPNSLYANSCEKFVEGFYNTRVNITSNAYKDAQRHHQCSLDYGAALEFVKNNDRHYDSACRKTYDEIDKRYSGASSHYDEACYLDAGQIKSDFSQFDSEKREACGKSYREVNKQLSIKKKGKLLEFGSAKGSFNKSKFEKWKSSYCNLFDSKNSLTTSNFNSWKKQNCGILATSKNFSRGDYNKWKREYCGLNSLRSDFTKTEFDTWEKQNCDDQNKKQHKTAFIFSAQKTANAKALDNYLSCLKKEDLSCFAKEVGDDILFTAFWNSNRKNLPIVTQASLGSNGKIIDRNNKLKGMFIPKGEKLKIGRNDFLFRRKNKYEWTNIVLQVELDERESFSCPFHIPPDIKPTPKPAPKPFGFLISLVEQPISNLREQNICYVLGTNPWHFFTEDYQKIKKNMLGINRCRISKKRTFNFLIEDQIKKLESKLAKKSRTFKSKQILRNQLIRTKQELRKRSAPYCSNLYEIMHFNYLSKMIVKSLNTITKNTKRIAPDIWNPFAGFGPRSLSAYRVEGVCPNYLLTNLGKNYDYLNSEICGASIIHPHINDARSHSNEKRKKIIKSCGTEKYPLETQLKLLKNHLRSNGFLEKRDYTILRIE